MNPRSSNALILFTSHPAKEVQRKKIYPDLSQAQQVYRAVLRHILSSAQAAQSQVDFDFVVVSEPNDLENIRQVFDSLPLPASFTFIEHQGSSFEGKLTHAFSRTQALGYQNIGVVGNDCLDITPDQFANAFLDLAEKDVVIGPATDGGFYLFSTSNYSPEVFSRVDWFRASVFAQVVRNAKRLGCTIQQLDTLQDIDSREDLQQWIAAALVDSSPLATIILQILKKEIPRFSSYRLPFIAKKEFENELWQLPPPALNS